MEKPKGEKPMTTKVRTEGSYSLSSYLRTDALGIVSTFVVGGLVYGVFVTSLGFYWDDWPVVWVYNSFGSQGVATYFAGQRPAYGWVVAHVAQMVGIAPVGWHILSLIVRCTSSVVLFLTFCTLWPQRRDFAWLVSAIVLLYPGFTLQPIALGFLEYHLSFLLFVVSLAATVFSITRSSYRWLLVAVSLLAEALSYIVIEYFVGLEFMRLLIIAVVRCRGDARLNLKDLNSSLLTWSPYAVVWAGYVVWRTFIFHAVTGYGPAIMNVGTDISKVAGHPVVELAHRTMGLIHNILMSSILAWVRPFGPRLIASGARSQLFSWIIAAVVVAIGVFTLRRINAIAHVRQPSERLDHNSRNFHRSVLTLGVAGMFVAGIPFMVSGQLTIFDPSFSFNDRFSLSFMLPASMILACLITLVGTQTIPGKVSLCIVLFAFSAYQSQNCAFYRHAWSEHRSLFWQIAWRAPVLKQGTNLLVDGIPLPFYANHSAGTLDMLYGGNALAGRLNYFMFDLAMISDLEPLWTGMKLSYRPNRPLVGRVRWFEFEGTTSQSVVAWISPTGTFRVVTQPNASEMLQGSSLSINLSQLSRPEQVISDSPLSPAGPLLRILGPESEDQWLYFYQKAELQRQLQHWGAVAQLGDEVRQKGDGPKDPSEWFPFIDGYTRTHQYQNAASISIKVLNERPDALEPLTSIWRRVKREDPQDSPELREALAALEDSLPIGDPH